MTNATTWDQVVNALAQHPWRTPVRLPKRWLPHPATVGMTSSVGMPEGQVADYRWVLLGNRGLHVKDFEEHYEAHLDEMHPDVNWFEHLRQDAPGAFVGGSVALGAALGGLAGRNWQSALAGGAIAGIISALLAAHAQLDD